MRPGSRRPGTPHAARRREAASPRATDRNPDRCFSGCLAGTEANQIGSCAPAAAGTGALWVSSVIFPSLGGPRGLFPQSKANFDGKESKAALSEGPPRPSGGSLHRSISLRRAQISKAFSRRDGVRVLQTTTEVFCIPRDKPRERSAEGRKFIGSAHTDKRCRLPMLGRGSAHFRGALAFQRSTCGSRQDFHVLAQLQARLPGTRVRRALPALACPSPVEAPHTPAVVPESMMPGTARERFAKPRAGAALAPLSGVPSRRRPRASKIALCNQIRYKSQYIS